MHGVNKVILVGNATRDAELHQTKTGKPVANLRLATNRAFKTGDGSVREETQYHTIICFECDPFGFEPAVTAGRNRQERGSFLTT